MSEQRWTIRLCPKHGPTSYGYCRKGTSIENRCQEITRQIEVVPASDLTVLRERIREVVYYLRLSDRSPEHEAIAIWEVRRLLDNPEGGSDG